MNSEELKLLVASEVEKYPCLWQKQDRSHKNLLRRTNAWETIAETVKLSVKDVKKIWKSVKDSRRYKKSRKSAAKSGDAASDGESEEQCEEYAGLDIATQFLDQASAENLRTTVCLGGEEDEEPSTMSSPTPTTSTYSYASCSSSGRRRKLPNQPSSDPAIDAAIMINDTLKNYVDSRKDTKELEHVGLWLEVESYFKDMDVKTVRDLKMRIINMVHQTWNDGTKEAS